MCSARSERGVVAIEFALVLPLILIFLLGIVEFGRAINYLNDANQIAADGARFAAVANNPGGSSQSDFETWLETQGDTKELREGSDSVTAPLSVCVALPSGNDEVGSPITVRATTTFQLIPLLGGVAIDLKGEATMRIERQPGFSDTCGS